MVCNYGEQPTQTQKHHGGDIGRYELKEPYKKTQPFPLRLTVLRAQECQRSW